MYKLLLIAIFSTSLFALNQEQLKTLQTVRDIAKLIPDKNGETFEDTLSSICLTESSGGRDLIGDFTPGTSITKASLGAMQIQAPTARFMAKTYKKLNWINDMSPIRLANKLIRDVEFSATIAAYYMKWLSNNRKTYFSAVSGYNGGLSNWKYYKKVKKNMVIIRKAVQKGLLN